MAIKKCPNGHQYDSNIYADRCPFCPNQDSFETRINDGFLSPTFDSYNAETKVNDWSGNGGYVNTSGPTVVNNPSNLDMEGGRTIIRDASTDGPDTQGERKVVGILVSYDSKSSGDVFKVYEGITTIGRDRTNDVVVGNDNAMSNKHLSIQFVLDRGIFRATEMGIGSSNGSIVNGKTYMTGEYVDLKTNDVIILGNTRFLFLAIPNEFIKNSI